MTENQGAANCRWGVPTLLLNNQAWTDADQRPWSCLRDGTPQELETAEPCRTCMAWEARPEKPVSFGEPCDHLRSEPYFLDILS